jgi:hypothetical protein
MTSTRHAPGSRRGLIAALLATALAPLSAQAADPAHPTVVELFTSQGCSSCVPALSNLILLDKQPDVLALSFGVTYWDQLGWKDSFGQAAFTQRQIVYAKALGKSGPATPQMVVNGRADAIGNDVTAVRRLIARTPRAAGPALDIAAGQASLGAGAAPAGGADVWLVRYDPRNVPVPIRKGENGGRTLPHKNVVHELVRLGAWDGRATSFRLPPAKPGLLTAVLVQAPRGGPILAAARG